MNTWQLDGVGGKERDQTDSPKAVLEGSSADTSSQAKGPTWFRTVRNNIRLEIYNAMKTKTQED